MRVIADETNEGEHQGEGRAICRVLAVRRTFTERGTDSHQNNIPDPFSSSQLSAHVSDPSSSQRNLAIFFEVDDD